MLLKTTAQDPTKAGRICIFLKREKRGTLKMLFRGYSKPSILNVLKEFVNLNFTTLQYKREKSISGPETF